VDNNGRSSNGRFTSGNRFGDGRHVPTRMQELRKRVLDSATPEQAIALLDKLYESGMDGDVTAAKLWFDITIGKPAQAVQISGSVGTPLGLQMIVQVIRTALGDDQAAITRVAAAFQSMAKEQHGDDLKQLGDGS
jgi:hypothetical protein